VRRRRGNHRATGLTRRWHGPYRAPVITALIAGVVAGYGIAIPVGAISLLIVETGLRRGFRLAAAAGAGAASADGIYAIVAAAFGAALASVLAPFETPLRVLAVVLLVVIAGRGLLGIRATGAASPADGVELPPDVELPPHVELPPDVEAAERGGSALRTYGVFLGLTLLNPVTVTYFAALILGLTATGAGPLEKAAFVTGAFLASLSWQLLIAAVGAFLHQRLPPRLRVAVIVLGNAIILVFAAVIAADLLA